MEAETAKPTNHLQDGLSEQQVLQWQKQMPVTNQFSYLDHAAVGPLTLAANEAMSQWLSQATESGDYHWLDWSAKVENARQTAARLVGAEQSEIALVGSTTEGITMIAEGFPFEQGDNVVIPSGEFPANVYPWLHLKSKGVELRQVEMPTGTIDLNRLEQAIDHRTRIVSVSWIGYSNGFRIDPAEVAELVHRKGALFFLDAIQGVGVFPLNLKKSNVDFMAADGHKWMLGPEGAGIAFIKQELLNLLRPTVAGWTSVKDCYNFDDINLEFLDASSRYEGGTKNQAGFIGLGASLETLESFGLGPDSNSIANQVLQTTSWMVEQIKAAGFPVHCPALPNRSGILSFEIPSMDPAEVRRQLLERKVITSCRGGKIRLAIHGYNTQQDLQPVLEFLSEVKK